MPYVYIFQSGDTNYFKIGRTRTDVEQRRRELSTGNPQPLKLFDCIETEYDSEVEKMLHAKFHQYRSKDGDAKEFFIIDPALLKRGLDEVRAQIVVYFPAKEDAEQLKAVDSNGVLKPADDEVLDLYKRLDLLEGQKDNLEYEAKFLRFQLMHKIADADGFEGIATWKTQTRMEFDEAAFRQQHPELFEEFRKPKKSRVFRLL